MWGFHFKDDKEFTTALHLQLHGSQLFEDEVYQVVKTCRYSPWASREIICDDNYMEASDSSKTLNAHASYSPDELQD